LSINGKSVSFVPQRDKSESNFRQEEQRKDVCGRMKKKAKRKVVESAEDVSREQKKASSDVEFA
jgi:hypothetical protein